MRLALLTSLTFYACLTASITLAEIDSSTVPLDVVPAFPKLQWPDWVLGLDEGLRRDPRPIIVTGAGDESGRIYVATQYGSIHYFENSPEASEMHTLLDIRDRVMPFKPRENEEGFLGLAFHPDFKNNGQFVVYYSVAPTEEQPHLTRISRFHTTDADHTKVDAEDEEILLEIDEPYWNHNGGTAVFGPDGKLYLGVGDGGAYNDLHMNAQNLHSLLGKILRIDIDTPSADKPYSIPPDNPFAKEEDRQYARGEIWAYGVRNPWRVSFDRGTGTCWIGDVGQNLWEEIDIIEPGGNYGWNLREGAHPFGPGGFPKSEKLIEPIWEYHHDVGKSITGGHVYRGAKLPEIAGAYIYADYVSGQIWALQYDRDTKRVIANRTIRASGSPVITFGEDDEGEIYFSSEREIFKFVPQQ